MQSNSRRFLTLAVTLCLGCSISGPVFAQAQPSLRQSQDPWHGHEIIQKLHLTPAQQKKFSQISLSHLSELSKDVAALHAAQVANNAKAAQTALQRFKAANDQQEAEFLAMMNPTQRKQWKQFIQQAQQRGLAATKQHGSHTPTTHR